MADMEERVPARYFGFHYKALRILGIGRFHHPDENNFNNYPTFFYAMYGLICTSINIIGYTTSETFFAIKVWQDKRESSLQFLACTMVGVHIFATIKILIIIKNNKTIQKIVHVLEIDSKRYNGDPHILQRSNFRTKVVTGFFFIVGEITMTCMAIYSIIADFDRKKKVRASNFTAEIPRDIPFTAYVPWDTSEDLLWAAGFIYSVFGMYWMGSTLIICDTMIASIMTHISGQFTMVQKVMENIGDKAIDILYQKLDNVKKGKLRFDIRRCDDQIEPNDVEHELSWKNDDFTYKKARLMLYFTEEDFNLAMIYCLKEAIEYHQMIVGITKELQDAYSNAFFCQTLSSFYVIGLILVQTAQDVSNIYSMRFFNTLGFLFSILWQLFSQTYSANEITLEAEKVYISAYSSKWFEVNSRGGHVGRLIAMVQHKAQRPLHLTAGKFAPMSNALFVAIIRSAYQIFTLITTTMSGDK
ncbi:odorant receptor 67c-like [Arctopsyche grandis]|uniref:odorant receptor 67c-like n=1 Tax=Arctopsyche grandis TaxID=121162 RepID=UPI00406D96E2